MKEKIICSNCDNILQKEDFKFLDGSGYCESCMLEFERAQGDIDYD